MAAPDQARSEQLLAEMLAQIDEAIAQGKSPDASSIPEDQDLSVDGRLHRAASVLRLLDQMRPGAEASAGLSMADTSIQRATDVGKGGMANRQASTDSTPSQIGRFRVLSTLGQGGFGMVFRAYDPELDREVALKVPRPEVLINSELQSRFLKEGRSAAALNHANVVPVFEAGKTGAVYYLASALCEGSTLGDWIKDREEPLDDLTVADWMRQLAEAVQHAHSRGILHRDLKPSNVMLAPAPHAYPTDETRRDLVPMVTDFGLAKHLDEDADETQSRAVMGTPNYMSPEQARGATDQVGPASDIYSLRAVFYFLLVVRPPLEEKNTVALLQAVQFQNPTNPRKLRPSISADLSSICLKCLEKDIPDRYASASELAEDLQRFLDGEPVRAHPVSPMRRLGKWCRRNPVVASLSTAVAISLIAALVASIIGLVSTNQALDRESIAREDAELAQADAEQRYRDAWDAVDQYFTQVSEDRLLNTPGLKPLRLTLLNLALGYYQKFLDTRSDDPDLKLEIARAHSRVAQVHQSTDRTQPAIDGYLRTLAMLREQRDARPESLELALEEAKTHSRLGNIYFKLGEPERAHGHFETGLELLRVIPEDNALYDQSRLAMSDILNTRGLTLRETGDSSASRESYEQSLEIVDRLLAADSENAKLIIKRCHILGNLANVHRELGEPALAEQMLLEVLNDLQKLLEEDEGAIDVLHSLAQTNGNLANSAYQRNDRDALLTYAGKSLDLMERLTLLNPQVVDYRRDLVNSHSQFGAALMQHNRISEALTAFRRGRELATQLARNHPELPVLIEEEAYSMLNLAVTLSQAGEREEAGQLFEEAVPLFEEALERSEMPQRIRISLAMLRLNLGTFHFDGDQYAPALVHYGEAIELFSQLRELMPGNPNIENNLVGTYTSRANIFDRLGDVDAAVADRLVAIEIGPEHERPRLELSLAITHARAGDTSAAMEVFEPNAEFLKGDRRSQISCARFHSVMARCLSEHPDYGDAHAETIAHRDASLQLLEMLVDQGWFDRATRIDGVIDSEDFEWLSEVDEFRHLAVRMQSGEGEPR